MSESTPGSDINSHSHRSAGARHRAALIGELYSGLCFATAVATAPFLDRLSAVLFVLTAFLLWAVTRYSRRFMSGDPGQTRFTVWLCITGTCIFPLVLAQNLGVFVAAWCATSIALHRLLQFYADRPAAVLAAREKFLISRLGDLCLISALGLAWFAFGTWNFARLFQSAGIVTQSTAGKAAPPAAWIAMLLVLAALLKSAQFPFHTWLPDTMEAPTPVSALMHAGIINGGGILVLRLSPLIRTSTIAMMMLTVAGAFTALFAGVVMLTQVSVKRSLAFSTVAQMGFMMFECGLGAFNLALIHIVAHSLFKAYAFLSSGRAVFDRTRREKYATKPAVILSSLCLAGAICGVFTYFVPGAMRARSELRVIFALAIAQMLWNLWSGFRTKWGIPAGITIAAGLTALYFALEWTGSAVIKPFPYDNGVVGYLAVAAFAVVAVAESQLPRLAGHRSFCALWVHARNGFYLNTLANRLTTAIWPQRRA